MKEVSVDNRRHGYHASKMWQSRIQAHRKQCNLQETELRGVDSCRPHYHHHHKMMDERTQVVHVRIKTIPLNGCFYSVEVTDNKHADRRAKEMKEIPIQTAVSCRYERRLNLSTQCISSFHSSWVAATLATMTIGLLHGLLQLRCPSVPFKWFCQKGVTYSNS